ncbi:unnamed protein product [Pleuronectes platessa]|uniref:Uncharacterized protein n=1 Tax=Pleuronectes platessa TaxID=8262 RepID=A0A9N7VL87_PLEPL|nr:unnamed protein product [Pleuronectes platessa]
MAPWTGKPASKTSSWMAPCVNSQAAARTECALPPQGANIARAGPEKCIRCTEALCRTTTHSLLIADPPPLAPYTAPEFAGKRLQSTCARNDVNCSGSEPGWSSHWGSKKKKDKVKARTEVRPRPANSSETPAPTRKHPRTRTPRPLRDPESAASRLEVWKLGDVHTAEHTQLS